jgi:hypothetical protein
MRPCSGTLAACALALLAAAPAPAAWNNVFQVCCNNCQSPAPVQAFSPVQPGCPPQQNCVTRYIQRSYYAPVVSYRQSFYLEPVVSYRQSYYYEPVVSYRYSCYFDPCTCSYQQVATPVTCYQLRSRCCPVTSYLQRCAMQPVTTYEQRFYWVPQVTCCQTVEGAPIYGNPPPGGVVTPPANPPGVVTPPPMNPPGVGEERTPNPPLGSPPLANPPGVGEQRQLAPEGGMKFPRQPVSPPALGQDVGARQPPRLLQPVPAPEPPPAANPVAPPRVRIDRIASLGDQDVEGRVVTPGQAPLGGARVLFVNADRERFQQEVSAGADGRFHVALAAGSWLVYVHDAAGRPVFHQKIDVGEGQAAAPITLVKR